MSFTLEYFPADGSASTLKDLGADGWGFEARWGGAFRSLVPDVVTFSIKKTRAAVLDTFQPRSRFILRDANNNILFQGVNGTDGIRKGKPNSSTVTFTISGPWWYLEGLPFARVVVTDYWTGGAPNVGTHINYSTDLNAFNLNRLLDGTYQATRAQLIEICNFAIGRGAFFRFDGSTFPDIAILPVPWKNGFCANAVRGQLNDIDAVSWFDHTTTPPTLHIKQAADCISVTRTLGPLNQVIEFDINRRDDLRVPYVAITFESGIVVNGVSFPNPTTISYPNPRPTGTLNNFFPFVATVTLNPLVLNSQSARVYTTEITQDVTWLAKVRPEYGNPAEYQNLAIVPNSFGRASSLPRMFLGDKGNYASWMGGNVQKDTITLKVSYTRVMNSTAIFPVGQVQEQTVTIPILATDINADAATGLLLTNNQIAAVGESPATFASLPQTIYTSLNTPCYEGSIRTTPCALNTIQLGNVLNLLGDPSICRPEWNTMNALIHEVAFETHGGPLFFLTANIGPNKKLTTGQLRERIEAKRLLFPEYTVTYSGGQINTGGGSGELPDQRGINNSADGQPAYIFQNVFGPPDAGGARGNVLLNGNATTSGNKALSRIEVKRVDTHNNTIGTDGQIFIQPDMILISSAPVPVAGQGGNQIIIRLSDLPANGNNMIVAMRKISYRDADNNCMRMSFYCLASLPFADS